MAQQNLTPRQKMINMMYLVLTAILALNVSAEVLEAFKNVNDGISLSNNSLQSKNTGLYTSLDKEYRNDSLKAKEAYEKSQQARVLCTKLYSLLEMRKQQIIQEAGGIDPATGKIKHDDNVDIATRIFVEDNGKQGKELKAQIETTRADLLKLLNDQQRAAIEKSLALKVESAEPGKPWEFARFNSVPVVAAVTLLSKYENDLLSSESHVIETLYESINGRLKNIDKMEAAVISPNTFILQGEQYSANVMVAAMSTTQNPEYFLGQFNSSVKKSADGGYEMISSKSETPPLMNPVKVDAKGGLGKIQMPGVGIGDKKYTGVVRVRSLDGSYEFYPFEGEYQVAPKMAVVAPQKLNVLYIGLDNPVDISVPGIAQSDVTAVFDGDGKLEKNSDGSYKALVTTQGPTKIKVSAKINGRQVPMGEQQFRVKVIPNPITTVDGVYTGGNIVASIMKDRKGVVPKSDGFVYGDLPWEVKGFTCGIKKGPDYFKIDNVGPVFNDKVKDILKGGLKKGDAVFIDDIMVKGPDQKVRKINPISFYVSAL